MQGQQADLEKQLENLKSTMCKVDEKTRVERAKLEGTMSLLMKTEETQQHGGDLVKIIKLTEKAVGGLDPSKSKNADVPCLEVDWDELSSESDARESDDAMNSGPVNYWDSWSGECLS